MSMSVDTGLPPDFGEMVMCSVLTLDCTSLVVVVSLLIFTETTVSPLSQFAAANIDVAVSNTKPRLRRCFTMAPHSSDDHRRRKELISLMRFARRTIAVGEPFREAQDCVSIASRLGYLATLSVDETGPQLPRDERHPSPASALSVANCRGRYGGWMHRAAWPPPDPRRHAPLSRRKLWRGPCCVRVGGRAGAAASPGLAGRSPA